MSIRLRLALCYGALFAVILLLVMGLGYAIHARGEYDDLDRIMLVSIDHAAAEATSGDGEPHLVQGRNGLELALRLFSPDGSSRRVRLARKPSRPLIRARCSMHLLVQHTTR